jgi:hypothetical protein
MITIVVIIKSGRTGGTYLPVKNVKEVFKNFGLAESTAL